jgi:hypothetical protein
MASIRSEGGLLPADLLARVAALDRDLGGLAVSDFHLAPNERLGEAIARSWARLTAAWEAFSTDRDGLPAGDHAGKITRERWLLPLFSELGYGRLIQQSGVEIDGKTYAVFCEYNHSPVHLVGAGVPLDRRTAGVRGAADQSPHSVVQELLNRSSERLWGIVTNGLSVRLLRDNVTLTRQAYVEFDLEAIFAGEAYEDFALLWLCAHQSRLEAQAPEECWLERWTQTAQRDGTRALGELRSGVERAIEALGRGFLAQPANTALHDALRDGSLDGPEYYRELLRLIYRLLFLFVAEDRDVLLLPDDGTAERFDARERYDSYYATKRLRRLSIRRRGGRAHDLYEQLKLLSDWLHDAGQPLLALPPLGSALWNPHTTAHISDARLGNEPLLEAIRELSFVEDGRRPVDFRNLGSEELGSVYESLLELHPAIDRETARFALTTAAGHERKQTGSYYTPTSLIGSLLETALDPVVDAAAKSDVPEQALLDLTVCDPACGSGHFLIAAANRIAKRLAAVREHDPEPAPEAIRHALRDVVSRCIHGVDVNPMAVELCKVSLWLEALEPGRPLSFLDDRILCGNSLLGTTPALIEAGVPDEAYKQLLGDDKDVLKAWRQHNGKERKGQTTLRLDGGNPTQDAASLAALAQRQRAIADDTAAGVLAREAAYTQITDSAEHERLRLAADTWVAAFTTPKQPGSARITTGVVLRAAAQGRDGLSSEELAVVGAEGHEYRPLHWHVSFAAVFRAGAAGRGDHGWEGGFDCVVGNPPWERVKLQENEFFAGTAPEIAAAKNKTARDRLIVALKAEHPELYAAYRTAKRRAEGESHVLRASGRYPLCGRGDVNTYAVFAEGMRSILAPSGRLGVIVPTGIATDDTTKLFFADTIESGSLVSLYSFWEARRFFEGKDDRSPFCLLTIAGRSGQAAAAEFAFDLRSVGEIADVERRFVLTGDDIALLNPNTHTCPMFRTRRDAEITKDIYRRVSVLVRERDPDGNPWGFEPRRVFDLNKSEDLACFVEPADAEPDFLPHYGMGQFHQFDHRFATYVNGERVSFDGHSSSDPTCSRAYVRPRDVMGRLRVGDLRWLLAWRDFCRSTDERTCIAAILPASATDFGVRVQRSLPARDALLLLVAMNSFCFDYLTRLAQGGTHLSDYIIRQLPIPSRDAMNSYADAIESAGLELVYTALDLQSFAEDLGMTGPPFVWDATRRERLRAELDALMFHLYEVPREDVDYILDTFPIVRRKEERRYDEYRTKRLILEAYDRLAVAALVTR